MHPPTPLLCSWPRNKLHALSCLVLCNPDSTLSTDVTFVVLALEMSMSTKADTFRQKPTLFRLSSVSAGCVLHFSTVSSFPRLPLPSHFSLNLFLTSPFPAQTLSLKRCDFFFCPSLDSFPSNPPKASHEHNSLLCRLLTAKPSDSVHSRRNGLPLQPLRLLVQFCPKNWGKCGKN